MTKGSPVQARVGSRGVEETIREALRRRAPLALSYREHEDPRRTVHPQVLYLDAAGTLLVDCYQVSGPTRSGGAVPGWRAFELAQIAGLELGDGEIGAAPGLNLSAAKYSHGLLAHILEAP